MPRSIIRVASFAAPLLLLSCESASVKPATVFDYSFVDLALEYFVTGDEEVRGRIVNSRAAQHLATHASRTSEEGRTISATEIVEKLMHPRAEKSERAQEVRRLLSEIRQDSVWQKRCISEANASLPRDGQLTAKLYFTYGYDIGVAVSGNASLNLAHDHFLGDPDEVKYYCVHELHHAGFQAFHPLPSIGEIATTRHLVALVEYLTQLEGPAVHAAHRWREEADALTGDPDYIALQDAERMEAYEREYFILYEQLRSEPDRRLVEADWEIVTRMSSGDRLWYRVGARMAAAIDDSLGRGELLLLIESGPRAFLEAYLGIQRI